MKNSERYNQHAPWREFVKQMRQIKIKRLRSMNGFAETSQKFTHNDLVQALGLKQRSTCNPKQKDSYRSDPGPPARPGAYARLQQWVTGVTDPGYKFSSAARVSPAPPIKHSDPGKQKGIDNRALDQHCDGKQREEVNSIARLPFLLSLDFLPAQQPNKKDRQCQRHVCAH